MNQLVFIENGKTVTDSLMVAEVFGKRHADVIRSIEGLECSEEFGKRNFALSSYKSGQNKDLPKYIITQDGFSFLVMGYTGKEAARFKEMYIAEFNRMREQLNQGPRSQLEILQASINQLVDQERRLTEQEARIEAVDQEVKSIREVVALNITNWRRDASDLIKRTAQAMGGYEHIKHLREESYRLLDERLGVSLGTRLTNKRRRMADEGVCKSKRDKLNYLDVIADDKKLIEGYVAIVKDMSVKYGGLKQDGKSALAN
ncbi:Rha family transcriptional regulator [Paenibacillus apiarius]|uniref:Rha family transcriptional regulator n=1 Tax=Paenibacillus apiarius TaxID=46240 RepID=UPI003B3A9255